MRYLTLAADYGDLSVRDEQSGPIRLADLDIPHELEEELTAWNTRYQPVIPLSRDARRAEATAKLIDELDHLGLELAERLAAAIPGDAKVRYYSEGRLRQVP
jgi:hypothetical protein